MTSYRYVEIECDSQRVGCDEMIGPERTMADLRPRAKAAGWRLNDKATGDTCPHCRGVEESERGQR